MTRTVGGSQSLTETGAMMIPFGMVDISQVIVVQARGELIHMSPKMSVRIGALMTHTGTNDDDQDEMYLNVTILSLA